MMLTIRDVDESLVRQAKVATAKGTGSQAFIAGIELMIMQRDRIEDLQEEVRALREQVGVYRRTLQDAHAAAVKLAEVAGQGDMFHPTSDNPLRPGYRR
ncbi:hypothetical protein N7335_22650 [Stutzerimonas stutzeri]|uniref:Uncharacterized protein n=1 Tax=Stutzerimonas stutzeri TaxID=316 RepID=A0AA42HGG9_STUST|nr:hypothetical protein [Stutzerimonas stutzeri]MDH0149191.1 hypothetical protein [Stutzerimonas stutzeri]MDH0153658.1 hypothetical protein [Stutzerimonas stutzeri]